MRFQDIKNIGHFLKSILAVFFYGFPAKNLKVIGVTGTDGKTTVVNLIYHLLKESGKKAGMISTVGARVNKENLITTGLHTTTPSPFLIQALLKKTVNKGCEYAVIEVTSHSTDQHRILGCNFFVGVITNISHEHLDYHGTINHYLNTKLRLLKNVEFAVVNKDDLNLKSQISNLKNKNKKLILITYGIRDDTNLTARNITQEAAGFIFDIYQDNKLIDRFKSNLIGEFNVYNILAAIAVAKILKISDRDIRKGVETFKSVRGRMEEVNLGQSFKIYIDYAHTPQAFQAILPTLKHFTKGRIIHVFGATGKRDKIKRPKMGEISGKLSDLIILTAEDTYGEDEKEIIQQIEKGVVAAGKKFNQNYFIELDRQLAINKAITSAKNGDTVILTGVGHQTTINKGQVEIPWSEYEAVKKAINLRKSVT